MNDRGSHKRFCFGGEKRDLLSDKLSCYPVICGSLKKTFVARDHFLTEIRHDKTNRSLSGDVFEFACSITSFHLKQNGTAFGLI